MRITKISVKGLFGMFDHEIPLNQESRITIMCMVRMGWGRLC